MKKKEDLNQKEQKPRKGKYVFTKIFDDPTPKAIINKRISLKLIKLTEFTDLTDEEKEKLFRLIILISRKLASVWDHYNKYVKYEDFLIEEAKKKPIKEEEAVINLENSQNLFVEFDEFLVQIKSCLDYLVKVPIVIFGENKWSIRTFGGKGNDVIKALKNNVPKEYAVKAKGLIHLIERAQEWLELTINARDKINHFLEGGIDFEHFTVYVIRQGEKEILNVPMITTDQKMREFFEICWDNLFRFCEEFIGMLIGFRIKKGFAFYHGGAPIDSTESPWKVTSQEVQELLVKGPGWKPMG